ncbi:sensor domain-containing protein [Haloquadratum walsbyi]|uniref:Putative sensor domain-containing protein n=1 Tax=Haloquadratum walsbyi J07HQW2 TaxID=1238425 RepID=U1NFY0_9EURY|nr:MAG: hypothetical protein J07HQW2_02470 [Haloquadratum walsbyi J07HQW2]
MRDVSSLNEHTARITHQSRPWRQQTYANLPYLLARFLLGIAYFTTFVTGLALGVSLIPVMVGIPILAGVGGLAGYVGLIEVELLNKVCGQDMSYTVADPRELSITLCLKAIGDFSHSRLHQSGVICLHSKLGLLTERKQRRGVWFNHYLLLLYRLL